MATAYSTYFAAIRDGFLPAARPVVDMNTGGIGLATHAVRVKDTVIEDLALSDNRRDRAKAAIIACDYAGQVIQENFQELELD